MPSDVLEQLESPTLEEMLMFTEKWGRGLFGAGAHYCEHRCELTCNCRSPRARACLAGRRGTRHETGSGAFVAAKRVSE